MKPRYPQGPEDLNSQKRSKTGSSKALQKTAKSREYTENFPRKTEMYKD